MLTSITAFNGSTFSLVSIPVAPGPASIEIGMSDAVAMFASPFSGVQQTQSFPGGDGWDATITLPPMYRATAWPWEAFLAELRGKANVFQLSDPRLSMPPVGKNLVMDSNYLLGSAYWTINAALPITAGVGHDGGNAFVYTGTGADSGGPVNLTAPIPVVPGRTYTASAYISLPAGVTASGLAVKRADNGVWFGYVNQVPGQSGRITFTFTVPYDCGAVVILSNPVGTYPLGAQAIYSNYQLEIGATASAYTRTYGALASTSGTQNLPMTTALYTKGWPASVSALMLPGDQFQVGYRLHRVCEQVNSDGSGNATISVWPSLRETPPDGTPLTLNRPQGLFRLADNRRVIHWSPSQLTTVSLKAIEAK
ncbi:MAG TPA: carbohydrate binding domain-containing protein [Terracidiphilus sp.]|nr:carbohydrate binding domain-containing protein [Terracidiphilus sp.]